MQNIELKLKIFSEKLKLFSDYVNRAWQRFNWFITLTFALISIILSNFEKIYNNHTLFILWSVSGFVLSLIWAVIGYEDFRSIGEYSKQIKNLETRLLKKIDTVYLDLLTHKRKFNIKQTLWLFLIPCLFSLLWSGIGVWRIVCT